MLEKNDIAIVGAGNIGRALIGGLLNAHNVEPERIRASRRNPKLLSELAVTFPGIRTFSSNAQAVRGAGVVVLAIKPQGAQVVLEEIKGSLDAGTLVISVLAGLRTTAIENALGRGLPVVRAMPNTPMIVDEGATAIAAGTHADDAHLSAAWSLFDSVGMVEIVPEYLMDAVTGVSGNGPAYVYMFIEALTDGGVKQGIPRPQAFKLAAQTVYGAAKLVVESGKHPAILKDEVTTPGGTAIAAVADLESHGMRTMLINAVAVGTARSKELGES